METTIFWGRLRGDFATSWNVLESVGPPKSATIALYLTLFGTPGTSEWRGNLFKTTPQRPTGVARRCWFGPLPSSSELVSTSLEPIRPVGTFGRLSSPVGNTAFGSREHPFFESAQ